MSHNDDLHELEKIRQLRIQYSHYYDTGDIDGIVSLFTEDAIVDAGVHGGAEGIDNVRAYFAEQREATGRTLHFVSNPRIELTSENTATGAWYLQDAVIGWAEAGQPPPVLYGTYSDDYVKVDGEWKFSAFRVSIEAPTEL